MIELDRVKESIIETGSGYDLEYSTAGDKVWQKTQIDLTEEGSGY